MLVNISLVVFNLLPAFPMDGGRVLRALLAMRMDYVRATQVAASIGQGMAFLFGLAGLFGNPFLLFIAFFVWIGASQEASMVQMRDSISGIPVTNAMQTKFEVLSPSDRLDRVVSLILAGSQQDFPVVEDGQFVGVLTRDDFIRALSQHGQNTQVGEVLRRNIPTVDSHEMVEMALMRLQESGAKTLPVMHRGRFVGLVTSENITEFLMIRSALRTAGVTANPIM
jgi:CBS domain-containing protein